MLDINGTVLGWIRMPKNRSEYEPKYQPNMDEGDRQALDQKALFELMIGALKAAPSNFNFSQFDNDNDGDIDLVHVIYAGPDTDWGGFWWAYQWRFDEAIAKTKKVGGKKLAQFIFQFEEKRGEQDFNPVTAIHEAGHALGLPDLYDYQANLGPDGGVGGLDMMHGNMGNHNALSRWLLDWITPTVVRTDTAATYSLLPSGSEKTGIKALAIFPGLKQTNAPGQEMFIIENRKRIGNDGDMARMPSDGLLIWHVDSSSAKEKQDFAHDNSYTDRLLIRLVRARTGEKYFGTSTASSDDYFVPGLEFGPTTTPPSEAYDGRRTNIIIKDIKIDGDLVTLDVGAVSDSKIVGPLASAERRMPASVSAAIRAPVAASIDTSRLEQLDQELGTATAEDLSKLWETYKGDIDRSGAITQQAIIGELILLTWAAKDGRAAIDALTSLPDSAFVRATYPRLLQAWANEQPASANDWYFAPAQARQRQSDELVAGADFTRHLFAWRAKNAPATAADAIDALQSSEEIFGAVEGLTEGSKKTGRSSAHFDDKLQSLKVNAKEAVAMRELQLSWKKS